MRLTAEAPFDRLRAGRGRVLRRSSGCAAIKNSARGEPVEPCELCASVVKTFSFLFVSFAFFMAKSSLAGLSPLSFSPDNGGEKFIFVIFVPFVVKFSFLRLRRSRAGSLW